MKNPKAARDGDTLIEGRTKMQSEREREREKEREKERERDRKSVV